MKYLLIKEHYCYKILTLPPKSSAYPHSVDTPYMNYPTFLQENLEPQNMIFQKPQPHPIINPEVQTMLFKKNTKYIKTVSKNCISV